MQVARRSLERHLALVGSAFRSSSRRSRSRQEAQDRLIDTQTHRTAKQREHDRHQQQQHDHHYGLRASARHERGPAERAHGQARERPHVEEGGEGALLDRALQGHQGAEHVVGGQGAQARQAAGAQGAAARDQEPATGRTRRQAPGARGEGEATKGERVQVRVRPSGALPCASFLSCLVRMALDADGVGIVLCHVCRSRARTE